MAETKSKVLAEGTPVIRDFGVNLIGLFMYDQDGNNIEIYLPPDANNKRYRLILEEIQ